MRMLRDSVQFADLDIQARMLAEQKVEAARVLEALEQALKADAADLLSPEELATLRAAMNDLYRAAENDNADTIAAGITAVDKASAEFASRRMDASIRLALKGHQIDEV